MHVFDKQSQEAKVLFQNKLMSVIYILIYYVDCTDTKEPPYTRKILIPLWEKNG